MIRKSDRAASTAKRLRRKPTLAEKQMWSLLRGRKLDGYRFRRQKDIDRWIVDFVCYEHRLIVELEGGVHVLREIEDAERKAALEALGFRVLRVSNGSVFQAPAEVLDTIVWCLRSGEVPD